MGKIHTYVACLEIMGNMSVEERRERESKMLTIRESGHKGRFA